jgi:hypothetical protein
MSRRGLPDNDEEPEEVTSPPRRSGRTSPRTRARIQRSRNGSAATGDSKIADFLNKNGFDVAENLLVADEDGNTKVSTIKVVDIYGHISFIYIDEPDANVGMAPRDQTLVEVPNQAIISESDRGNYKIAGNNVAGVALDCGNGICTLINEEDPMKPVERNFVYVASNRDKTGTIEATGSVIAYPIVRLSEIRKDPTLCIKNINEATCRLRDKVREFIMNQLTAPAEEIKDECGDTVEVKMSVAAAIKSLGDSYDHFLHCLDHKMKKTQNIICQLEAFQRHHIEHPPYEETEILKMKANATLLRRWNIQYVDQLKAAISVNEKKNSILAIKEDIDSLTKYIENNFHNAIGEMNKLCVVKEIAKCPKKEEEKKM